MAERISINTHVATGMSQRPVAGDVTAIGDPHERFEVVLRRAVRAELDPEFTDRLVGIRWQDPDYPEQLMMLFPQEMTMAAVAEYFGPEIEASPPTIQVDDGGYGGDTIPEYVIELINTGIQLGGYVGASLAVQRSAVKAVYAKTRRLAKDWNDSGRISPELRESVLREPRWRRKAFDQTFGLDAARGPELLRDLGYSRREYEWGEYWERSLDD